MADVEDQHVCPPEKAGLVRGPDVTVDSGAAVSVSNPDSYPDWKVTPSFGSKAGQRFVGAFGQTTPNLGQLTPEMYLESGDVGALNFQAARVKKPLAAVTDCNKKGNCVWFDGHKSCLLPANCPQLAEIRRLIAEVSKKVPLHWEKGVYKMHTWVKPKSTRPFPGQGR